jgi:hypothetical protein
VPRQSRHPGFIRGWPTYIDKRSKVSGAALQGTDATEALEVVRSLIERVVLHPAPDGQCGFEIELVGQITAMVSLGQDGKDSSSASDHAVFQSSMKVVAGAGNHRQLTPVMVTC